MVILMNIKNFIIFFISLNVFLPSCTNNSNNIEIFKPNLIESIDKDLFKNILKITFIFPDYMVEDYKNRNFATKELSIKKIEQIDEIKVSVYKTETNNVSIKITEKIISPTDKEVSLVFSEMPKGLVNIKIESYSKGGIKDGKIISTSSKSFFIEENKLNTVSGVIKL